MKLPFSFSLSMRRKISLNVLKAFSLVSKSIFVVDSYSTDKTLDLLKENKIEFTQHEFINYSAQRNWIQTNYQGLGEWVFHIDADERLTPDLQKWITDLFENESKNLMVFFSAGKLILWTNGLNTVDITPVII